MKLDKLTRDRLAISYLKQIYLNIKDLNTKVLEMKDFERIKDVKYPDDELEKLSRDIYRVLTVSVSTEEFNSWWNGGIKVEGEIKILLNDAKEVTVNFLKDLYLSKYDTNLPDNKRQNLLRFDTIESVNRVGSHLSEEWETWRKTEAFH